MLIVISAQSNFFYLSAFPCLNFEEFTIVCLVVGLMMTMATWRQAGWEKLTEPPLLRWSMGMEWGQRGLNSKPDGPEHSFIQYIKALNAFAYETSQLRNGMVDLTF